MPLQVDELFIDIAQLATPVRLGAHRGKEMAQLRVVLDAAIAVQAGKIVWAGAWQD